MVANTPRRCIGTPTFPGFELAFCHRSVEKNSCKPHITGGFPHLLTNLRRAGISWVYGFAFLLNRGFESWVRGFKFFGVLVYFYFTLLFLTNQLHALAVYLSRCSNLSYTLGNETFLLTMDSKPNLTAQSQTANWKTPSPLSLTKRSFRNQYLFTPHNIRHYYQSSIDANNIFEHSHAP